MIMWKLVIGFGSIIFFATMIIMAGYYIKQYLDEKNSDDSKGKDENDGFHPLTNSVLREINDCINFLLSLSKQITQNGSSVNSKIPNIPELNELVQGIITQLEMMINIIEKYPNKTYNMSELTEYIIPLIKKLTDDYCFYHQHNNYDKDGGSSKKVMDKCAEGLKGISEILYKKSNSMLEDHFYDIHSEVAVLLQINQD